MGGGGQRSDHRTRQLGDTTYLWQDGCVRRFRTFICRVRDGLQPGGKNYLEQLGRQAEAFGENYLFTDVMMRLIYDSAQAVADYERSPVWMHRLLDAFADGVNYYLFKHPETKPLVLKRFKPWYALMFTDGSVSATSTGGARPDEIKNFYGGHAGLASGLI